MSYIVRLMNEADMEEVEQVHLRLLPVHYSKETYQSFCGPKYLSLLLVDTSGETEKIIGFSMTSFNWVSCISTKREAYLSTFGVLPEYQREGLGSYLLQLTCMITRKYYKCDDMKLHMLKTNDSAYNFYTKNHLKIANFLPQYYLLDNTLQDAIMMVGHLKEIPDPTNNPAIALHQDINFLLNNTQHITIFHRWCFDLF